MTTTRLIRGPASRLLLLPLAPSSWHARPGRRARGPAQGGPRPVNLPGRGPTDRRPDRRGV